MSPARPQNSANEPIGIIAGNGRLPVEVAEALQKGGHPVFICAIEGEADEAVSNFPHEVWAWEQVGRLFRLLKTNNVQRVVLAGGVVGRPVFKVSRMDWGGVRTLPGVLATLLSGDNAILTGVISIFEKRGFEVCNISELLPELVVAMGANTATKPKTADINRIAEGAAVSRALGSFDIGQACVVLGKRAVALEGVEGTDAMLQRVADLRTNGRLPKRKGGVLIKSVKPGQDERADLPAIGPQTIESVHAAGLVGIGVQAGKTLIVQREATLKRARDLGIFIYGYDAKDTKFGGEGDIG